MNVQGLGLSVQGGAPIHAREVSNPQTSVQTSRVQGSCWAHPSGKGSGVGVDIFQGRVLRVQDVCCPQQGVEISDFGVWVFEAWGLRTK